MSSKADMQVCASVENALIKFSKEIEELFVHSGRDTIILDGLPKRVRDLWKASSEITDRRSMQEMLDVFNAVLLSTSSLIFFRYAKSHVVCSEASVKRSRHIDLLKLQASPATQEIKGRNPSILDDMHTWKTAVTKKFGSVVFEHVPSTGCRAVSRQSKTVVGFWDYQDKEGVVYGLSSLL